MCSLRPQGPARFGGNARRAPNLLRCPEAGSSTLTICADFPFVRKRSRRFRHVGATGKHSQLTPSGSLPGATSTRTLMGNGVRMGRLMQAGGSTSGHPFIRDHVVTQALGELW